MFTIDTNKVNNNVPLLIPAGTYTFDFVHMLTKELITVTVAGVSNGKYTHFLIDGTPFKKGAYVVTINDWIKTKCVVIGVKVGLKEKWQ